MKQKTFLLASLLVGTISLSAQITSSKIIEKGSSGLYKSIAVSDNSLSDYVIYRPQNLQQIKERIGTIPLFIFANGGCNDTSIPHEKFLSEIASHGYIVIALGALQNELHDREIKKTQEKMIPREIDWMLSQNANPDSEYYNIISTDKIAIGGQSCGGADALSVASDPRVKTYLLFNSGMGDMTMFGATPQSIYNTHAPIIYIAGGPSDVAYANAQKDFERITHTPVVFTNLTNGGHGGTFDQQYGGTYSKMTLDWLDFIFNGANKEALFIDADLTNYPGWTLMSKNFEKNSPSVSADLTKANTDASFTAKIDSVLQALVDQGKISCVSAFVGKGGDVVYSNAFGYKDVENKIPARSEERRVGKEC